MPGQINLTPLIPYHLSKKKAGHFRGQPLLFLQQSNLLRMHFFPFNCWYWLRSSSLRILCRISQTYHISPNCLGIFS